jgi:branched-chain amino acid transport system substrate-binding protein
MKKMELRVSCFLVVAAFVASLSILPAPLSYAQEPIKVGWVGGLTGQLALQAKFFHEGFAFGIEEINAKGGIQGRKIEIIKEDSENKPALAVNIVQKLITKDNVLMLWTCGSSETLAVVPIVTKAEVVLLAGAFTPYATRQGSKYVFRAGTTTDGYARSILEYALKKKGFKKIGIIASSDALGQSQADSFEKILGEFGLKAVSRQKFNIEDRDFTGQLLTIQRAEADVLCLSTTEIEAGLVARQARSLGMKIQFICPQAFVPYIQSGGVEATEGSIFSVAYIGPEESPRAKLFAEKFTAKYKYETVAHNIIGYDGASLVGMALQKAYPKITRQTFRDALAPLCNVELVQGTYCFNERGEGIEKAKIAIIRGGKVYPAP